jgi:hypothetical protein
MTTALQYVTYIAILTARLGIPYIVSQVIVNRFLTPAN